MSEGRAARGGWRREVGDAPEVEGQLDAADAVLAALALRDRVHDEDVLEELLLPRLQEELRGRGSLERRRIRAGRGAYLQLHVLALLLLAQRLQPANAARHRLRRLHQRLQAAAWDRPRS